MIFITFGNEVRLSSFIKEHYPLFNHLQITIKMKKKGLTSLSKDDNI
ncbi:hypothetical protein [Niallia sp. Marseille-Q9988]